MPMITDVETTVRIKVAIYVIKSNPVYPDDKNHNGVCQKTHISPNNIDPLMTPDFFAMTGKRYPRQQDSSPVAPCIKLIKKQYKTVGSDKFNRFKTEISF